jgi:hypothetical protein
MGWFAATQRNKRLFNKKIVLKKIEITVNECK